MFEVHGKYANRKGRYTVLEINEPKMTVRYEDGSEATLNIDIQERIWENILAEEEAKTASRNARRARWGSSSGTTQHFIKVISIPSGNEVIFPGWEERVVMARAEESGPSMKKGDRLIYYALEAQTFFAVATITGEPFEADPKKYTFTVDTESAVFYPIDIDADVGKLEKGVPVDSVELESWPNFGRQGMRIESFWVISEDDFELLAEALTEVSEEEEEDYADDDDYQEDEDE